MSIASRITSMENNIRNAYHGLDSIGIDTTNTNKNIENISALLEDFYDSLPKVSGTGSILSLSPTLKGRLGSVLKGNTLQDGTPSPSSPIEIQSATGTQKVIVSGKNLFDYTQLPIKKISATETIIDNGIKVTDTAIGSSHSVIYKMFDVSNLVGTTFTIKANWVASGSNLGRISIGLCDENGDNRIQGAYNDTSNNSLSYTIPTITTSKYLAIWLYSNTNGTSVTNTTYVDYTNIQLEPGSTATEYEAYQSQTKQLNLGNIKLNKIGDYQDYITGTPDNWSIKRQIGSVVLNGSETVGTDGSTTTYRRYTISKSVFPNISGESALSNYFTYLSNYSSDTQHFYIGTNNLYFFLLTPTSTANDFKTWLSTHNTEIDYILETETTEIITNQEIINQLNEIYNLQSYNGTTNITITSEDLELIMTASAIKGE